MPAISRLDALGKRTAIFGTTGVGRPVYELIRDAIRSRRAGSGVALKAVTFTHGLSWDRKSGKLGKAFLVSRLQRLLQTHCLQLPAGHPEAQVLARELADYEIRIDNETAVDRYGAFKVGTYDELATALGLAVLEDPAAREVTYGPRIPGPRAGS
jgi:hypothetical protein